MMAWIFLSIAAAAFQTLRFMLQKTLSMGRLSAGGATLARFFYSAPFVATLAAGYWLWSGVEWPGYSRLFWTYALTGGLAQILATWCVVALFAHRNFAVGITFKKTEVIQTAIIGFIVLGDMVSSAGMVAILLGLVGVLVLSDGTGGGGLQRFFNRAAGLGLLSGLFFAVSAVGYRGATLEIGSEDPFLRAVLALAAVTVSQTIGLTVWLIWREPGEMGRVIAARRTAVWMGITGMAGSICWFTAFTLQNAAYVFVVGQIEVVFSIAASVLFFGEKIARKEYLGIGLLTFSILALVILG
ncbi:DMT family transporter [Alisedimentitalea sp. MJ-SS2]|uniref:DMT family transporter n=1 Tax=Aliisedimentitalea sp. MJ-SS2 TaxID=3049795 RepID=UPI0029117085|nr:DMT family transporter [Alisedimentitalea sp. MJ-SS2]MDU8927134.1 DMT family transporter [Alisedimentitalea sp. MJ-SS2]